jgi:hypothetical protein
LIPCFLGKFDGRNLEIRSFWATGSGANSSRNLPRTGF